MNMNFQRPNGLELEQWAPAADPMQTMPKVGRTAATGLPKSLAWSGLGLAAVYGIAQASAAELVGIGITAVALIALATAVCHYALNNTLL